MTESHRISAEGSSAARERRAQHAETIAVVLISLGGLATSWSSYQAGVWSGEQSEQYVAAVAAHQEASRVSIEAGQLQAVDVETFLQIVAAYGGDRGKEAEFLRARLRAEFRPAFDAWLASNPMENAAAPPTPFALPQYRVELREQAARHESEARRRFAAGQQASDVADQYVLIAVVLASVMFLSGICQPLKVHGLKLALIALATALMLFGLYHIAVLPRQ